MTELARGVSAGAVMLLLVAIASKVSYGAAGDHFLSMLVAGSLIFAAGSATDLRLARNRSTAIRSALRFDCAWITPASVSSR
jgi:hypothetical protein